MAKAKDRFSIALCCRVVLFVSLKSKERKWGSISLHGGLESDSTTADSLDMPAARSRSSGERPDGGWVRS